MGALLEDAGYRVLAVPDADAALAALAEHHHDAVVTDVLMPGKSGLDLLDEIGVRWPEVAVLLITGEPTLATAARAMRAGAYDYLAKPIRGEELAAALGAALDRRERRASALALQVSEASLAVLIRESPVPMLVSRDGVLVSGNKSLANTVGSAAAKLAGADALSILHEDDRERVAGLIAALEKTGRASPPAPVRLLRGDGEVAYCVARGIPISYTGKPSIAVVMAEITRDAWQAMMTQQER